MDLSANLLTTIATHAFQNLSSLKATNISIDLKSNYISNIEIGAFSGIENDVTYLYLSRNELTYLPRAIINLSSLRTLDILINPLVSLDASVLLHLRSTLNVFTVSIGKFSSFPDELRSLSGLSTLTINGIQVPVIKSTVFNGFENSLTTLEMSDAKFESFPAAICRLTSLQKLVSNHSPNLSKRTSLIFDQCINAMTTVTSLSLYDDLLTTIPRLAPTFPNLQELNLFGNALHFIESSLLDGLNSLKFLYLSMNHFTRIPFAVNKASNLRRLRLDTNQIDTIEDLDLSGLQNLTELSLNDNPLVYISPLAFEHNPSLEEISMHKTHLDHVPRALLRLTNLRVVSFHYSPINCSCQAMNYLKFWNLTSVNIHATCSSGKSVYAYLTSELPKCH